MAIAGVLALMLLQAANTIFIARMSREKRIWFSGVAASRGKENKGKKRVTDLIFERKSEKENRTRETQR